MASDDAKKQGADVFVPAPHANAESHARVMGHLRRMTPMQLARTLVDAGITGDDGQLTAPYHED